MWKIFVRWILFRFDSQVAENAPFNHSSCFCLQFMMLFSFPPTTTFSCTSYDTVVWLKIRCTFVPSKPTTPTPSIPRTALKIFANLCHLIHTRTCLLLGLYVMSFWQPQNHPSKQAMVTFWNYIDFSRHRSRTLFGWRSCRTEQFNWSHVETSIMIPSERESPTREKILSSAADCHYEGDRIRVTISRTEQKKIKQIKRSHYSRAGTVRSERK